MDYKVNQNLSKNVTNNSIEIEPNKLRRRIKNFIIEKFNLSKNWKLRDGDKVKNQKEKK